MKPASSALVALLASSAQLIMADLYTISLVGGSVLRYSAAPTALTANNYNFVLGPKFERSKTKVVIGTQVDELDVWIYPEPTDLIGASSTVRSCSSTEHLCQVMGKRAQEPWSFSRAVFPTLSVAAPASTSNVARISSFLISKCRADCGSHRVLTPSAMQCASSTDRACRRRFRLGPGQLRRKSRLPSAQPPETFMSKALYSA
jgi:hypothetical protein